MRAIPKTTLRTTPRPAWWADEDSVAQWRMAHRRLLVLERRRERRRRAVLLIAVLAAVLCGYWLLL